MAQMGNLTLADGQTTPVNHTFSVITAQAGTDVPAKWRDIASYATPIGQFNLSMLVRRTSNADKVSLKLTMPGMSTDGTMTKIHTSLATADFILPDTADAQQRKDLLALMKNALANSIIQDAVHNGSPAY